MNDITALAQRMKAAAERATPGNWRAFQYRDGRCGIGGGHHAEIMVCEHISKERPHDAEFIALVNPDNVLALVEALEARDMQIAEMSTICAETYQVVGALADAAGVFESSEGVSKALDNLSLERMMHTDVIPFATESRTVTVKLPAVEKWRKPDAVRAQNAYRVLVVNDLAAAGIQVIEGDE